MIKINNIYILLLIFGCAYQGAPQGGPEDNRGPVLLDVYPVNKNNINKYEKIIITFDENINPTSVINSVSINSKIDITTQVKGNKIIIKPLVSWPKGELVEVNLNRSITDFQLNNIDESIQLIYNIGSNSYCSIAGDLYNYRDDRIYNIFVYEWPIDISKDPFKKINTDKNHNFEVNYLEYGKYVLIASEGNLDIHNNRYGINTVDYI